MYCQIKNSYFCCATLSSDQGEKTMIGRTADTNAGENAKRIARISSVLAMSCSLLMLVLPIAVLAYWVLADGAELAMRANLPSGAVQGPLLLWQRLGGALITEIPLALLLIGLWQARKCFKLFAAGQVFTAHAVLCLRRFAGWVVISVLAGIVATAAISALLTLNNPPGMRHLAIGVGSDQIFTMFFAGMVWLMAAVIGQGHALAEENASLV
jgi:Protein of unknown function (DUF2975)